MLLGVQKVTSSNLVRPTNSNLDFAKCLRWFRAILPPWILVRKGQLGATNFNAEICTQICTQFALADEGSVLIYYQLKGLLDKKPIK